MVKSVLMSGAILMLSAAFVHAGGADKTLIKQLQLLGSEIEVIGLGVPGVYQVGHYLRNGDHIPDKIMAPFQLAIMYTVDLEGNIAGVSKWTQGDATWKLPFGKAVDSDKFQSQSGKSVEEMCISSLPDFVANHAAPILAEYLVGKNFSTMCVTIESAGHTDPKVLVNSVVIFVFF